MTTYDTPDDFRSAWRRAERAAKRGSRRKDATVRSTTTRSLRTGLSGLVRRGWAVSYDALLRVRLTRGHLDTDYHTTEGEACQRARELEKASKR